MDSGVMPCRICLNGRAPSAKTCLRRTTYLKDIRKWIDQRYQGRILLAEANQWPADVRPYFGDGNECHMAFHFPLMPRLFMGIRSEDWHPIVDMFTHTPAIPEDCQWCLFLRNHDELTLEMCSGEERDYMYYAYARDPQMRRNIGIARRLAPLLENDRRKIELLNSLVFTLPGSPIIYYGDEIGMGDNVHLGDRNGVRTPMQWNADRNAGFSKADPSKLYLPVISDSIYGYQATNVEAQMQTPYSLVALDETNDRRSEKISRLRTGYHRISPATKRQGPGLPAAVRGDTLLIVHNLGGSAQAVELELGKFTEVGPGRIIRRNEVSLDR